MLFKIKIICREKHQPATNGGANMKIAVLEDEQQSVEAITQALDRWSQEVEEPVNVSLFACGEEFIKTYAFQYDVVFLDIILGGITGLETAEKLRKLDQSVIIIFLTNMAQYAIEGYKYSAQDYFVKPVSYYALKMRMDRIRSLIDRERDVNVTIPQNDGIIVVPAKDIYYIESFAHETTFHTASGVYKTRDKPLRQLETELYPYNFRRCNVSYLVNLRHCKSVKGCDLSIGGDTLTISRAKRKEFMREMSEYLSGGRGTNL